MNLSTPKVSVLTPVYNGSEYLSASIRSILCQSYKDFELIICDNRSTDNTAEIVHSFEDKRIHYFLNEENLGLVGNANRCLELARGEYIHILHHDDIMLPDNLARKVEVLFTHPRVGFVHSNALFIDETGAALNLKKFHADRDYIENGIKIFRDYILSMPVGASIFIGSVMARKACYDRLGKFNPLIPNVNDSEMWMRMLLFYDVACIEQPLVKYRLHGTNTSTAIQDDEGLNVPGLEEHFHACKIILTKFKNRIPNSDLLEKQVASVFSMRALNKGVSFFKNNGFRYSWPYFKAAFRFNPPLLIQKPFWVIVGELASKIARKLHSLIIGRIT